MGFDQICLYHLVMFDGLDTEWSKDPKLLARLPDNPAACDNWLRLREDLLSRGFEQTTLTNFERREVHAGERRYLYEERGFHPEAVDALAFGPNGISHFCDFARRQAVKLLNPSRADDYSAGVDRQGRSFERWFHYEEIDLKILYLTRKMALLGLRRADYAGLFGGEASEDFPRELERLAAAGLLDVGDSRVELTPTGMFFADTVAGLLAWRRLAERQMRERAARRESSDELVFRLEPFDAKRHSMG